MKVMFYEMLHGHDFANRPMPQENPHRYFPAQPFEEIEELASAVQTRVALVRDPVSRIVSCFKNKVLHAGFFKRPKVVRKLKRVGLSEPADLQDFVSGIEDYRANFRTIDMHSKPLSFFLGRDANWFSRIFDLASIRDCATFIADLFGREVTLPHWVRSGHIAPDLQVTVPVRDMIEVKYAEDIEVFGAHMKRD